MEIFKGTATFSGIAIGKILYYSRGEYQIRQSMAGSVKKEVLAFRDASLHAAADLKSQYEEKRLLDQQEAYAFFRKIELLESESFRRAIEDCIKSEKVNAAYAVMLNRDEMTETFRGLEA